MACNHISTFEETARERPARLSSAAMDAAWPSDTTTTASSRSAAVRLPPLAMHPDPPTKRERGASENQLDDLACSPGADGVHGRRHQGTVGALQALRLRWLAVRVGLAAAAGRAAAAGGGAGVGDIGPGRRAALRQAGSTRRSRQYQHSLTSDRSRPRNVLGLLEPLVDLPRERQHLGRLPRLCVGLAAFGAMHTCPTRPVSTAIQQQSASMAARAHAYKDKRQLLLGEHLRRLVLLEDGPAQALLVGAVVVAALLAGLGRV